jgi:hypothetical protein
MALPPHMTHLMQPLDVSVFHQRAIANQLRYEKLGYGFIDFPFTDIREEILTV